jgi:hypothetical protein
MKFISLIFTIAVLHATCYAQIDYQKAISIIKTYYTEHARLLETRKLDSVDVFDKNFDALQSIYCSKKLRLLAEKVIDRPGIDVMTDDQGIVPASINSIAIIKEPQNKDTFIVTYDTVHDREKRNILSRHVTLYIRVYKAGEDYRILSVNGTPQYFPSPK